MTLHYPPGVNVYVVAPSTYEADYSDLAEDTGGEFFDINSDFSAIIETIGEEITTMGDYMITFMSNDFSESRTHTIRIAVHTRLGAAQATAVYVSPDSVDFERARRQLQEFEARFVR